MNQYIFTINKILFLNIIIKTKIIHWQSMLLSRKESLEKTRDFICPCGKSYFSYAALFTHVKQKHGGKAPGEIIKPKAENKRGRPRKKDRDADLKLNKHTHFNRIVQDNNLNNINSKNYNTNHNSSFFTVRAQKKEGNGFKSYICENQPQLKTSEDIPLTTLKDDIAQQDDRNIFLQSKICSLTGLIFDLRSNISQISKEIVRYDQFSDLQGFKLLSIEESQSFTTLVSCMKCFLKFCKSGLQEESYKQIFLLITLLMEHIISSKGLQSVQQMNPYSINEYIESFFQKLPSFILKYDLCKYGIFNELNPTKILIMYYNWLSIKQETPAATKANIDNEHQKTTQEREDEVEAEDEGQSSEFDEQEEDEDYEESQSYGPNENEVRAEQ